MDGVVLLISALAALSHGLTSRDWRPYQRSPWRRSALSWLLLASQVILFLHGNLTFVLLLHNQHEIRNASFASQPAQIRLRRQLWAMDQP